VPGATGGPYRESLLRLLPLAMGTGIALLGAEGATRLMAPRLFHLSSETHRFDPELRWVQQRGLTLTRRNEAGETVEVRGDRLGIREPPRPYRTDATSVLVAGDSFAAGTQVSYDQTWTARLGEALRRTRPDVQVINAGVDGYDLSQSYRMVERLWPLFRPRHLVVSVFVGNDLINYEEQAAARPPWKAGTPWSWLQEHSYLFHLVRAAGRRFEPDETAEEASLRNNPLAAWIPRSIPTFARLEPNERKGLRRQFAAPDLLPVVRGGPDAESRLRATGRMLAAFQQLARERRASLSILLIPTKQQVIPTQRAEWMELHGLSEAQVFSPQRALALWAERHQVALVDLTPALLERKDVEDLYWPVNQHMSAAGHGVTSEVLRPTVERALAREF
jgi:hypothetical protein